MSSSVVGFTHVEEVPPASVASDDPVRQQVWRILAGLFPRHKTVERRGDQRFPYPYLVYLTPLGEDGVSPAAESIIVIAKHLSERGLGFYHQQPLPERRMIVSLPTQDATWVAFLIDITWCRFTQHGWYESGGRFLQAIPSPIKNKYR